MKIVIYITRGDFAGISRVFHLKSVFSIFVSDWRVRLVKKKIWLDSFMLIKYQVESPAGLDAILMLKIDYFLAEKVKF